jgi:HTH-type transcriptional regulator/antitoxin HigA
MTLTIDRDRYGSLLAEYQPQPITTEAENERALAVVEKLMAKERSLEEDALLNLWVLLVEQFEEEHYPISNAAPHEMLQFLMEQRDLRQVDLVGILGSRGVISEVVNGKRSISKTQAKVLGKFFHVSPELFI